MGMTNTENQEIFLVDYKYAKYVVVASDASFAQKYVEKVSELMDAAKTALDADANRASADNKLSAPPGDVNGSPPEFEIRVLGMAAPGIEPGVVCTHTSISKVNNARSEGYAAGFNDGCSANYTSGYAKGYDDGHKNGFEAGYDHGY